MSNETGARLKCALFIDFDNIYIGLRKISPAAASQFATNPAGWLKWIEQRMALGPSNENSSEYRALLMRRCYLNPRSFHESRPNFIRAAFQVIDCPPLTQTGKTSADIYMVIDILDALEHRTHFDEFIIFSGDADFAPVLQRLRAHDRRSTIFTMGAVAEAYLAAADRVVSEKEFMSEALGGGTSESAGRSSRTAHSRTPAPSPPLPLPTPTPASSTPASPPAPSPRSASRAEIDPGVFDGIISHIQSLVTSSPEPVQLVKAADSVRKTFGNAIAHSRWMGAGSFVRLLKRATNPGFAIAIKPTPGYLYDPERHELSGDAFQARTLAAVPAAAPLAPVSEPELVLTPGPEKPAPRGRVRRPRPLRPDPMITSTTSTSRAASRTSVRPKTDSAHETQRRAATTTARRPARARSVKT